MNPHPRRTFSPSKSARFGRPAFPHDQLVKFSPKWGYSRLFNFPFRGSHWRPRMHTVVIAVDGASKVNDSSSTSTRGSFGVFVGPESSRNSWGRLIGASQTNGRAELEAVKQGLIVVRDMFHAGELYDFPFRELIIKTDSEYVHDTFQVWIWAYVVNGFKKAKGNMAKHADLIEEIHGMICEMEGPINMAVRFWRVPRGFNVDADRLANMSFQDEIVQDKMESNSNSDDEKTVFG